MELNNFIKNIKNEAYAEVYQRAPEVSYDEVYKQVPVLKVNNDGNSFVSVCPVCGDQKEHFTITRVNGNSFMCNCFKCDASNEDLLKKWFIHKITSSDDKKRELIQEIERKKAEVLAKYREQRVKQKEREWTPVWTNRYEYTDANGNVVYIKNKGYKLDKTSNKPVLKENGKLDKIMFIENPEGAKGKPAGAPFCFNFHKLVKADKKHLIFIVEGEKDCQTLEKLGYVAITTSAGANSSLNKLSALERQELAKHTGQFVIIPDNDKAGKEYANRWCNLFDNNIIKVDLSKFWSEAPDGADITDYIEEGKDFKIILDYIGSEGKFMLLNKDNNNNNNKIVDFGFQRGIEKKELEATPEGMTNYLNTYGTDENTLADLFCKVFANELYTLKNDGVWGDDENEVYQKDYFYNKQNHKFVELDKEKYRKLLVNHIIEPVQDYSKHLFDSKKISRKEMLKFNKDSRNSAVELLYKDAGRNFRKIKPTDINNENFVYFKNGVYDLASGELKPFECISSKFTRIHNYNYIDTNIEECYKIYKAEIYDKYYSKSGVEPNVFLFLIGLLYSEIKNTEFKSVIHITGESGAGKSHFMDLVKILAGNTDILSFEYGEKQLLSRVENRRCLLINENIEDLCPKFLGTMKRILGERTLKIKKLYEDPKTIISEGIPVIVSNDVPTLFNGTKDCKKYFKDKVFTIKFKSNIFNKKEKQEYNNVGGAQGIAEKYGEILIKLGIEEIKRYLEIGRDEYLRKYSYNDFLGTFGEFLNKKCELATFEINNKRDIRKKGTNFSKILKEYKGWSKKNKKSPLKDVEIKRALTENNMLLSLDDSKQNSRKFIKYNDINIYYYSKKTTDGENNFDNEVNSEAPAKGENKINKTKVNKETNEAPETNTVDIIEAETIPAPAEIKPADTINGVINEAPATEGKGCFNEMDKDNEQLEVLDIEDKVKRKEHYYRMYKPERIGEIREKIKLLKGYLREEQFAKYEELKSELQGEFR